MAKGYRTAAEPDMPVPNDGDTDRLGLAWVNAYVARSDGYVQGSGRILL